ncbi:cytochrome p450 [Seiridium cupressi]
MPYTLDHPSLQSTLTGVEFPSVVQFRGISYGNVPARFAKPEPAAKLPAKLDCSVYGPRCPQVPTDVGHLLRIPLAHALPAEPEDEFACLNLDVVVPKAETISASQKLPVLFWVHGGSQSVTFGSAASGVCDPSKIVSDSASLGLPMIVVSVQYRLNIFAFGDETSPKNLALLDLSLALQWVQDHIVGFGGDPNRVTLGGESAGAVYCHALMVMDAPAQQLIMSSGTLFLSPPQPTERASGMISAVRNQLHKMGSYELRTAPSDIIVEAVKQTKLVSWFLRADTPLDGWQDKLGNAAQRLLLSDCQNEAVLWRSAIWATDKEALTGAFDLAGEEQERLMNHYHIYPNRPSSSIIGALDFVNDYKFVHPVEKIVRQWQSAQKPVFRCLIDEPNPWQPSNGAQHAVDLLLLFGGFDTLIPDAARRTGKQMREKWIQFINGKDPWDPRVYAAFGPYGAYEELAQSAVKSRRRMEQASRYGRQVLSDHESGLAMNNSGEAGVTYACGEKMRGGGIEAWSRTGYRLAAWHRIMQVSNSCHAMLCGAHHNCDRPFPHIACCPATVSTEPMIKAFSPGPFLVAILTHPVKMAQQTILLALSTIVLLLVGRWAVKAAQWRRTYKLPPQVPGIPIFGNTFQIPAVQQGPWAKKLAAQYGEMFTCKFGGSTWVFLNSSRVVTDLMERRAAIYSSRPPFPMTQSIMSDDSRIVLMPYNDKWRTLRKVMHSILSTRAMDIFMPFQDLESKHLLWDYLETPGKWWAANGRYANSVIMSVVFGRRSTLDDPDVVELFETIDLFLENQQPGTNIVDGFPVLEKLPKKLQWWRPRGEAIYRKTAAREVEGLQQRMKAGTQRRCFATDFLETEEIKKLGENQKLFVFGTLMEAGSDTSRVSLGQIIAGAATYPDWVVRARAELDAVCGSNGERLPQWEDRPRLKYISAVVKEGFRWRPNIAEIGAPTMLTRDDEYEGYKFPAGTVFTWNAWAIALNPDEYEQPERFWPERFLDGNEENALKGHWAFGPGRRVCVGWKVGEMNVWIAIARLLYCFDFKQIPGKPIDTMTIPQITKNSAPFDVDVTVRSPAHAALIRRDCEEAVHTKY